MSRLDADFQYTPLAESEQDAIKRMADQQELMVEVKDWGYHPNPHITTGDKRMQIRFPMRFTRPEGIEVPVRSFTLKLKMRDGRVLCEKEESTVQDYQPLKVTAGKIVDLSWDLALDEVPKDVRDTVIPDVETSTIAEIDKTEGRMVKHEENNAETSEED